MGCRWDAGIVEYRNYTAKRKEQKLQKLYGQNEEKVSLSNNKHPNQSSLFILVNSSSITFTVPPLLVVDWINFLTLWRSILLSSFLQKTAIKCSSSSYSGRYGRTLLLSWHQHDIQHPNPVETRHHNLAQTHPNYQLLLLLLLLHRLSILWSINVVWQDLMVCIPQIPIIVITQSLH